MTVESEGASDTISCKVCAATVCDGRSKEAACDQVDQSGEGGSGTSVSIPNTVVTGTLPESQGPRSPPAWPAKVISSCFNFVRAHESLTPLVDVTRAGGHSSVSVRRALLH